MLGRDARLWQTEVWKCIYLHTLKVSDFICTMRMVQPRVRFYTNGKKRKELSSNVIHEYKESLILSFNQGLEDYKLEVRRAKLNNITALRLVTRTYSQTLGNMQFRSSWLLRYCSAAGLQLTSPTSSQTGVEGEEQSGAGTGASEEKGEGWRVDGALELTQRTDGDATEIQLCHATPHDPCFWVQALADSISHILFRKANLFSELLASCAPF